MNVQRILLPTDYSPYNDIALQYASTLAAVTGALLHIVHVDDMHDMNLPLAISGPYDTTTEIWDRSAVRERLEQVVPSVPGVQHTNHYLEGKPVDEIVKVAERENVDLIVMASHGRTGLSRLLIGSIAEGVMREAPCAVLIVKQTSAGARRKPNSSALLASFATGDKC